MSILNRIRFRLRLWARSHYVVTARNVMRIIGLKRVKMTYYERDLSIYIPPTQANMTVKVAVPSASDIKNKCYKGVVLASGDDPVTHNETLSRLKSGEILFVARVENSVAGLMWVSVGGARYESFLEVEDSFAPDEAWGYDAVVFSKFRRNRISEKMLEESVDCLRLRNISKIGLSIETDNDRATMSVTAVGFYPIKNVTCTRLFKLKRVKVCEITQSQRKVCPKTGVRVTG